MKSRHDWDKEVLQCLDKGVKLLFGDDAILRARSSASEWKPSSLDGAMSMRAIDHSFPTSYSTHNTAAGSSRCASDRQPWRFHSRTRLSVRASASCQARGSKPRASMSW